MIASYFSHIWKDRYVLWELTTKALSIKYKRSMLGMAWSVLVPLGLASIIGCVYGVLFGVPPRTFLPILFSGLNVWILILGCADGGTQAFLAAEGYLKQTLVNIGTEFFSVKMLLFFPGCIVLFVFLLAVSNITAIFNLIARDYQPFQSIILQGVFYATPIIYLPSMLEEKGYAFIYKLNPFYYFISIIRTPLLGKEIAPLSEYIIATSIAFILFGFSIWLVMREKRRGVVFRL